MEKRERNKGETKLERKREDSKSSARRNFLCSFQKAKNSEKLSLYGKLKSSGLRLA
jgi:hypothetical protein